MPLVSTAYRVATDRTIAPFGDRVGDLEVATIPIRVWQETVCQSAGLELIDVAAGATLDRPALVFFDDVFFTEMALRNFVADAASATGPVALAMPPSPALRTLSPCSDAREGPDGARVFDVFVSGPCTADRAALAAAAEPVVQVLKDKSVEIKLPRVAGGGGSVEGVLTVRLVAHVRHWLHVLRLNQLGVGVRLLDGLRKNPRQIFRARRAAKKDPWSVGPHLNQIHPTASVHPKADLEGAIIGPGCVVRAHAHVHYSALGEDVDVGDHAVVMGCAFGDRVQVLRASYFAYCAALPGATLSSYKSQLSLFGRDVFLTANALLLDAKFRGEVRVEHDGELVSSGSPFLGSCLGHRVTLGANTAVQAGRSVPNDAIIVGPPGQVALDVPAHPVGTILTVRDGRAEPISGSSDTDVDT